MSAEARNPILGVTHSVMLSKEAQRRSVLHWAISEATLKAMPIPLSSQGPA